jgi:hypothetical protein
MIVQKLISILYFLHCFASSIQASLSSPDLRYKSAHTYFASKMNAEGMLLVPLVAIILFITFVYLLGRLHNRKSTE